MVIAGAAIIGAAGAAMVIAGALITGAAAMVIAGAA